MSPQAFAQMKDAQAEAAASTPAPTPTDATTPRKGEPSYIPEVWTERSVEDTLFLSGGKGIAHAHNYAITRATAEKDKLIAELQATQFEFCEECNFPLSVCGEQNPGGTPSMDCQVCQLRAALASRDAEVERLKAESLWRWCPECGGILTLCGEPDSDGEPTEDCRLCQLRAELSYLRAERDELKARLGPIDPGGSDKIDELESSMNFLRAERDAALSEVMEQCRLKHNLIGEIERVRAERDKAVAEVENLTTELNGRGYYECRCCGNMWNVELGVACPRGCKYGDRGGSDSVLLRKISGIRAERAALAAQVAALRERVLIADVASCTCQTKTPEPQYHAERCPHRVYMELLVIIDAARAALTGGAKP